MVLEYHEAMRHFLTIDDLTRDEIEQILALATELKSEWRQGVRKPRLAGRVLGLLFDKPSLRTRVSFQAGMVQLGGDSLYLGDDVGWGSREPVSDFARVLSQYLDLLVCRTHAHARIVELAQYSQIPIINGLTEQAHPCQALADVLTIREAQGDRQDVKIAFIGDGNNVSQSLAIICAKLGIPFAIAGPPGYELAEKFVRRLRGEWPESSIEQFHDPHEAVRGATVVYTDVWSSMGFEEEEERRRKDFSGYQVTPELMAAAAPDALFMHCLPAHRGLEVSAEVIDGPHSVVVEQAANRMHAQKGLMVWLSEHAYD